MIYQVYPRSFADSNGDGVGDIPGLESRLGYLSDLGVDALWICPWYRSPWKDGGYDVTEFREIDDRFGTVDDATDLIAAAHAHGMRVIVDVIPNHVSDQHKWFIAAVNAGPGSAERERFWFRSGRGDGSVPPTDWSSVFGGSAWTRLPDGDWYLHLFDTSQPDLDWTHPDVVAEFDDVLRFWLARGVDGFRVDVAQGMVKDPELPVEAIGDPLAASELDDHPYWNRPGTRDIAAHWRRLVDDIRPDVALVAEAWVVPARMADYVAAGYDQVFNFDFLSTQWDRAEVAVRIHRALDAFDGIDASPTWTLSNHDGMRHTTRFGLPAGTDLGRWPLTGPTKLLDSDLGLRRARAAALMLLALPGSMYLYQGEELGVPDVWDLPIDVLDDPVFENSGRTIKGRDGCRVPIPWTATGPSFGFGSGPGWLPQPDHFAALSVASQTGDPASTLELYRRALSLRRELHEGGSFEWLEHDNPSVIAFTTGRLSCVTNFDTQSIPLDHVPLLTSGETDDMSLPTDTTAWIEHVPDTTSSES